MKKVCCFFISLFIINGAMFAQQTKSLPFEEIKDGEYTVRLLPAPANTFGFDILKGDKLIIHQQFSPFHGSKKMQGLKKDDVLKVAKHLVAQSKKTGSIPGPVLPDKVAQELNIKL